MACGEDQCGKDGFTFIWRIENFKHLAHKMESRLDSENYYVDALQSNWSLHIIPGGNNGNNIACRSDFGLGNSLTSSFTFCFCTTNRERLWECTTEHTTVSDLDFDYPFPSDTLVLHCHLWNSISDRTQMPAFFCAITRSNVERKMLVWNIGGFTNLFLKDVWGVVPLTPVKADRPTLTFEMSFDGAALHNSYLQIRILFAGVFTSVFCTCKISLLGLEDAKLKCMTFEQLVTSDATVIIPHFITRRELETNPNDVLTLECEVTITNPTSKIEQVVYGRSARSAMDFFENRYQSLPHTLKEDLGLLYENNALSDFKVKAGGRAFPVHRILLSSRSPVFQKMFENDMMEKGSNNLSLPDLDSHTVDRMLRYVYTDAVPDDMNQEDVEQLYYAADKYQLSALRQRCAALLGERLDLTNVVEVFALADRHGDQHLMGLVQDFIFNRGRQALTADKWFLFSKDNPQLAIETLRMVCGTGSRSET